MWPRRFHIASRERWRAVLRSLLEVSGADFERQPVEIVVRLPRAEKTDAQRRLFHAVCADLGPQLGLTPAQAKLRVKADFYGVEVREDAGLYYALVPSSEDSDREEYSRLIDHAYQFAAEAGVVIPDRRQQ